VVPENLVLFILCVMGAITVLYLYRMIIHNIFNSKKKTSINYEGVSISNVSGNKEWVDGVKKKIDTWITIQEKRMCPVCSAHDSMLKGPSGGLAMNIKCSECKSIFWISPIKAMGAYKI